MDVAQPAKAPPARSAIGRGMLRFVSHPAAAWIWGGLYVLAIVWRFSAFAANFGGVEHDSGWYLGVAKNVADRGIYASYTNTIVDEGPGAFPSLHGRMSVQDEHGFSYFPAGVTAGPGYVLPEALILKVFGSGWWQYRAWPMLTSIGLIGFLSYFAWALGGPLALLGLQGWLWAVPQVFIPIYYEAFSEQAGLLFLCTAFFFLDAYLRQGRGKTRLSVAGLCFGMAILCKLLLATSGCALFAVGVAEQWRTRRRPAQALADWVIFGTCALGPIALFELYRFWYLVSHFGYPGWEAINVDQAKTFISGGSGVDNRELKLTLPKLVVWQHVGVRPFFAWVAFLGAPFLGWWGLRREGRRTFFFLHATAAVAFAYYLFVSPAAWARYAWSGMVLGMVCISVAFPVLIRKVSFKAATLVVLAMLFLSPAVVAPGRTALAFELGGNEIGKWLEQRLTDNPPGLPSWPIFSLKDQQEFVAFAKEGIAGPDRVYYAGSMLVAEMSPLIDKVFYPVERYLKLAGHNPDGGKSYLIMGPYQLAPFAAWGPDYLRRVETEACQSEVFRNPSYLLCELKPAPTR